MDQKRREKRERRRAKVGDYNGRYLSPEPKFPDTETFDQPESGLRVEDVYLVHSVTLKITKAPLKW